jgi:raffinose/stachyose/melibiose transport system permease protein
MNKNAYPTWFAGGAVLLYGVFVLLPAVLGFGFSFTDWNAYSTDINFVGLDNFAAILDPTSNYLSAIQNTVLFTVATIALKTVIALALALLLTNGVKRLSYLYRAFIFLPAVLPVLVVGVIFQSVLNPDYGLLNSTLRLAGLGVLAQQWLTDVGIALWSIVAVDTWRGVGYIMVIMIAGLKAISPTYYEAASIDGATAFQSFRHITLPLLTPVLLVTTVLNLLYGLRVFDMVFVLTNGGPGFATETVYTTIFHDFSQGRYGTATALSTLFFLVMLLLSFLVIRVMRPQREA